jgi:hypothetical protein
MIINILIFGTTFLTKDLHCENIYHQWWWTTYENFICKEEYKQIEIDSKKAKWIY